MRFERSFGRCFYFILFVFFPFVEHREKSGRGRGRCKAKQRRGVAVLPCCVAQLHSHTVALVAVLEFKLNYTPKVLLAKAKSEVCHEKEINGHIKGGERENKKGSKFANFNVCAYIFSIKHIKVQPRLNVKYQRISWLN